MKIRSFLSIIRTSLISSMMYRGSFFFTLVGKSLYLIMSYFLWKAVYTNNEIINNLSFQQTYLYIGLSMILASLFRTATDWHLANAVSRGTILRYLTMQLNFKHQLLAEAMGTSLMNFIIIVLPSLIIIRLLLGSLFPCNLCIVLFFLSILIAFLLNFYFDFLIGLVAFYTQSISGIAIAKESFILILSGALVPLAFFPSRVKSILEWLPFQALYNTPVRLLIDSSITNKDIMYLVLVQVLWLFIFFVFSQVFFKQAINKLIINGG